MTNYSYFSLASLKKDIYETQYSQRDNLHILKYLVEQNSNNKLEQNYFHFSLYL